METKGKNVVKITITYVYTLLALLFVSWVNNISQNFTPALRSILIIIAWWPMLVPVIVFMRLDKETLKNIGFTKEKIVQQILIGILVAIGSLSIFIILPAIFGFNMSYVTNRGILAILYQFIYMLFAVALVEEIIFRGYLLKKLLDINKSKWSAIIISSTLFGFFHILNWNLLQIIVTATIGFYWCLCKERLKYCTLLSLVIAHALHNTIHPIISTIFFG